MKKTKTQKGITLIALIITIIVLLILAVVAIRAVQESDIIVRAKGAATQHEIGREVELVTLAYNEYMLDKRMSENPTFDVEGATETGNESNSWIITFTKTGNTYTLNSDGEIEKILQDENRGENEEDDKKEPTIDDWTYTLDEESRTVTLTSYIGVDHDVYVPATFTINNIEYNTSVYSDRASQKSTFSRNDNIYSIIFEEGVATNEMSYMFLSCHNLRYINKFPDYRETWWISVFKGCTNLIAAPQIPNDIENIRISTFYDGCKNLIGNYVMPDSCNTNYDGDVFKDCININKSKNVVWFGDSITAGTTTNGTSFVTYLRDDLVDTGIANYAVGGRTLSYGYDQKDTDVAASIITDISRMGTHSNIDYVFVSAGTNDFAHKSSRTPLGTYRFADVGTVNDTTPTTVMGAINIIVEMVKEKFPNATLIFTTPITRANYDIEGAKATDNSDYTIHLKDFVDAIKSACTKNGVSYIDAYTESGLQVTEDACNDTQNYNSDQTHLTEAGQRVLEEYILNKLTSDYGFTKK